MVETLTQAFGQVLGPTVLLVIALAAAYSTLFGCIPGLSATMAVALVVPLTYFLSPLAALAAVVTLEACAISAGDIPSALMRIPGTPASAAYANDLYALAQRGQYHRALGTCVMFSAIGGLFGAVVLIFLAQPFARLATVSTVAEYFWFYVIGLGCAVVVTRGSALKGAFALLLGLLFSTVGLSAVHTEARFTFGLSELYQGINFIPAMIGLFGVSEVLKNLATIHRRSPIIAGAGEHTSNASSSTDDRSRSTGSGGGILLARVLFGPVWRALAPAMRELKLRFRPVLRSSAIGTAIGILPGAGADIAAWVAMAVSKR